MKTTLAAIASAILLVCMPLAAQAAPASNDPAVIAATRQMLVAMKARDTFMSAMQTVERQMAGQMRTMLAARVNANAALTPEQKADQLKRIDDELPKQEARMHALLTDPTLADDMLAEMVPLYAETYTLDEIRQLTAFYASPLGQKMQASAPVLMARSLEISQRVMMPRLQQAMAQAAPASAPASAGQ